MTFTQSQLKDAYFAHQLNNSIDLRGIKAKGYHTTYELEWFENEGERDANANKGEIRYQNGLKILETHKAIIRYSSECDATVKIHPDNIPNHDNWIKEFGVLKSGGTSHFVVEFLPH